MLLVRDAVLREPPDRVLLLLRALAPLRDEADFARVPLDLELDPLEPLRDFDPPAALRDDPLDDDLRWVLGDVLPDDERVLA